MDVNIPSPREWMRQLAALRGDAARLSRTTLAQEESRAVLNRALELTEMLRRHAADLRARCAALDRSVAERDRRMRAFVELIPVPMLATDCTGVVMDANARAAAFLSRSIGRLRHELLLHYAEDRAAFTDIVQRLSTLSDPLETRLRMRPRERAAIEVDVTVAPDVRDDSGLFLWFFSKY